MYKLKNELKVNRNDTKSLKILLWHWVYRFEVENFDFKFRKWLCIRGYVSFRWKRT